MSEPSREQVNQFVKTVDDFLTMRANVLSKRAQVYASNDPALINDFESFESASTTLKNTIENTTGAWAAAKSAYKAATDTSSTYIGDAVDWFREVFSDYDADGGLGLVQLPAAVWIAGIISAAAILWRSGKALLVRIDAVSIARAENIPYSEALTKSERINSVSIFGGASLPMLIALGAGIYWLWVNRK